MELSNSQIKSRKNTLEHLNECFYVFKYESYRRGLDKTNYIPFIQEKLKSYLNTEGVLITKEQIERCKLNMKEYEGSESESTDEV